MIVFRGAIYEANIFRFKKSAYILPVSGHEAVERMPDDDEVEARLDESREVVEVVGSHILHQSERQKRKSLAIENGMYFRSI